MKIALIGISGRVGSRLAGELLKRGHAVTGIARDVSNVEPRPNLSLKAVDANRTESLVPLLEGHDVVVSSSRFVSTDPRTLMAAVKKRLSRA